MTANTSDFKAYILEQLHAIPHIQTAPFFGGIGLTIHGVQFAMLMGNTLYFVVNDLTRLAYESLGSECFSYRTAKKTVNVRKYFTVPPDVIEAEDELVAWARQSINIAQQSDKTQPKKRASE